ncbi:type VI secretion system contractile sheath small subunit [Desulfobulbus sp. US1]|uniref:Type VI secretion system protein ImpB n=1 Tax=Candidatus Electrothrix communis TaxID=1859133 RepID=A0A3S3QLQ9_9BACT|nr:type VI secretion system contractile sheath small subunit [Desulfobulbus sp. US4]MCW5209099.1 type VI secretion system contractile sheath small subunit [Desulfobulbus sp. US1]MCW5210524.1 type VI secretion system contractile sheath small subunit [Desulfobulbus sp. N3]MCW5214755.1 type VI secretion system contractile sheath small subunit [Desulfobulbus sp. US5]RWX47955.1 type VI secretion system protein ImpB [Candidatus Electrothrix communis]
MAKQGSVAPKERVNIVYRPATGDAQEEVELPLKILVMGDFQQAEDDRAVEDREPINVDKDNFNDIMKAQGLGLNVTVPNKLSDDPDEEMNVKLAFASLKDFSPDAVAENTPELKKLMELRQALTALKGPLSNIPEFRKKIQSLVKDEESKDQLLKELGLDEK